MIEDLDCARNIIDDFLVWGVLKEKLDHRLKRLLDKACEYNPKLTKKSALSEQSCTATTV